MYDFLKKIVRNFRQKDVEDNQDQVNYPEKVVDEKKIENYYDKYMELMPIGEKDYDKWIKKIESRENYNLSFLNNPLISLFVVVTDSSKAELMSTIYSIQNQIYSNWELIIINNHSMLEAETSKLERNTKIKVIHYSKKELVADCLNQALEVATGEFVSCVKCGDLLSTNALYEIVKLINNNKNLDFIYSDEDKIEKNGEKRYAPHFKQDWAPDTLLSFYYTKDLSVFRKSVASDIGGYRSEMEGAHEYDFILRFTEKTNNIAHVAKVLYHEKKDEELTVEKKNYYLKKEESVKKEVIKRRNYNAELELVKDMDCYRLRYISEKNPLISIIIPSKDNYDILERCIHTLVEKTEYKNYEIILVDNGSNEENYIKYSELAKRFNIKYIYEKMVFNFSRMCNIGASNTNGEYLLFLNDDVEIINGYWLTRMLGQAELSHIGAVGAKLLYPDGENIQHVGVLQLECGPGHAFTGQNDAEIYYFGRNRIEYDWIAVTAACLLVNKEKFELVNGFSEELAVAYNDVDFCYKLLEAGYYNVVRNDAILYHHESVSRGNDMVDVGKMSRLMKEQEQLYSRHPIYDKKDPFYNRNFTQQQFDFSYRNNVKPHSLKIPKVSTEIFKECENMHCSVDAILVVDNMIFVDGWAFVAGRKDNNDINLKILLKGLNKDYLIETDKVYRADVAEAFSEQKDIDFVGYKCKFSVDNFENGEYQVAIVSDTLFSLTEKKILI